MPGDDMLDALRDDAEGGGAEADRLALQQLTMLMLTGFGCALLILTFLILASVQAVSLIDNGARTREALQVARAVSAAPTAMNDATLAIIADTLDLDGARLTTPRDVAENELSVPVPALGQVVAWMPHLAGTRMFETVAPARIGAGAVFMLLLGIVGWRSLAIGRRLDRRRALAARLANTDTLTGLGNRRAFDDGLAARFAAAGTGDDAFALITLDLDGFKAINDTHGHAAGDAVLRPATGLDAFLMELKARMMRPLDLGGRWLHVSASVGMARSADFSGSPSQLTQAADIALYRAKRSGPGNAELATPVLKARRAA
jgi:GGDEF domain-containing protein